MRSFAVLLSLLLSGCLLVDSWRSAPGAAPDATLGRWQNGVSSVPLTRSAGTEPEAAAPAATHAVSPLSRGAFLAEWNALRGDSYALDTHERWLDTGERVSCDPKAMLRYSGEIIRYSGSVLIHPVFKERLTRFEQVVAEVSKEVYGREPRRLRHYGAFSCRTTRNRSRLVSEHALGNALDVVGFDFAPATKTQPLPEGAPKVLRHAFQVRVARHWAAEKDPGATHARFFAELTQRLAERDDIFRSMFGPGHGGHDDHLHLDVSPWRYVDL